jgi:hypothetical protein
MMMRRDIAVTLLALTVLAPYPVRADARLILPDTTVGQGLQAPVEITLGQPAPDGGLAIRLTSTDPSRLLLATSPEAAGSASISILVGARMRVSPEFWVRGRAATGAAAYTAAATGFETVRGEVRLARSGFVFSRARNGIPGFMTTTGSEPVELSVQSARLDAGSRFVAVQAVAEAVAVPFAVSNPAVGTPLAFPQGQWSATTHFQPSAAGSAKIATGPLDGFTEAADFGTVEAIVKQPGLAVTTDMALGRNLQVEGILNLGEPAPPAGVTVTLRSSASSRLLISSEPCQKGSEQLALRLPPGAVRASYYLQALDGSGEVTYTASAPGFLSRTGTIALAPSGVVVGGPPGPPDEAELLRKEVAQEVKGFVAGLTDNNVKIAVYSVQLDPVTRRAADITVQALRAGLTLQVKLENSNPAVAAIPSTLTIDGGSSSATGSFSPLSAGSTVIAVVTPVGFERAGNSTALTAIVRP